MATHHGAFDITFLRFVPNLVFMAPKDEQEFVDMLYTGLKYSDGPIALRYPRGSGPGNEYDVKKGKILKIGKAEILKKGKEVAMIGFGHMVNYVQLAANILETKGIDPTIVNLRFAKPLDEKMLATIFAEHKIVISVEENARTGGVGTAILEFANSHGLLDKVKFKNVGLPDSFIEHGTQAELHKEVGIIPENIAQEVVLLLDSQKKK